MARNFLFLLFFISYLFICNAQDEEKYSVSKMKLDSLCSHFKKLTTIDFDVTQKSGCDFIITQLLNETETLSEDTLYFQWYVFNEENTVFFEFNEENPDIFIGEPGNYHIELVITNIYGCTDTLTKYNVISIDKMPQINFTFTPENALFAEYFGEVIFTNLTDMELLNDSTVVWYWEMGDEVINMKDRSPVHLFSAWGDYHTTFHLKTKNGCNVALTKTVTIEDELFFPDIVKNNSKIYPPIFAVINLNTNIPKDDTDEFRNNHLFVYDETGRQVYEQKNYDSFIKNNSVVRGVHALGTEDLATGNYFYSFYYKGKSKIVHYSGTFAIKK